MVLTADADRLERALDNAGKDVNTLWPGRDRLDGAVSLLAIALDAALGARVSAPESVTLGEDGRWLTSPRDVPASGGWAAGGAASWQA